MIQTGEIGVSDHGALEGLSDDDHTQYLKEKASGGLASEIPTHTHASSAEGGTVAHSATTGLATGDPHTQYPILAPATAARNTVIPTSDIVPWTLRAGGSAANLQEWQESHGSVVAKIDKDGKATTVDANTGFSDPNSHFQAANDSLNALVEEVGYVVAQGTRDWLAGAGMNSPSYWNQTASFVSSLGWVRVAADGSSVTLAGKALQIPKWAKADGGNYLYVDVYWSASAAPVSDEVWRVMVEVKTWDFGDADIMDVATMPDTALDITVASTISTTAVYKSTVTITSPDLYSSGDEWLSMFVRRLGSHANDTYAGDIRVLGLALRSGVKST